MLLVSEYSTYFEWVSMVPGLETRCEVVHMDELSLEGYRQLTTQFFENRDTDNGVLAEQKIMKGLVEMRSITKNRMLSVFYSAAMLAFSHSEDYMQTQSTEVIFPSDHKLHGPLYTSGVFTPFDPLHHEPSYCLPVPVSFVYKTRFIQYLELFRFLYDFMSLNLVIRRSYFETFLRKSAEFSEFFKDIKGEKSTLHGEAHQITYKLATVKDKMGKIQQLMGEKAEGIRRREKDIGDLEIEMRNNREQLGSVIWEKDKELDKVLAHMENINGSEFQYVISTNEYRPEEKNLLDVLAVVLDKDSRVKGDNSRQYFLNREELLQTLNDSRNYDYDDACFTRLKDFINLYTANDLPRPLFKQLFHYLMELYRKLNVRNTMASTYARIKEIKESIDSSNFSINYARQFIEDKRQEMVELEERYARVREQEGVLSKRIEEAEISHMRTEQIFMEVDKYCGKVHNKLKEVRKRIDTLLGDCIILAASVAFLGVFSVKERM